MEGNNYCILTYTSLSKFLLKNYSKVLKQFAITQCAQYH